MMYAPIKKLSRVNATLQQAMAASERIFEILDTHSEVPERAGREPLTRLRQAIEFRNVSFSYDGVSKTILKDVSFSVRSGQAVAIVGLSGAGKTTLVNLVPRFYDVSGGSILIDGIDIRDVTLASLRSQIGIVTQDTVLFDDTIAVTSHTDCPERRRKRSRPRRKLPTRTNSSSRSPTVRDAHRRAGPDAVGRPKAAAGHCPGAASEFADSDT